MFSVCRQARTELGARSRSVFVREEVSYCAAEEPALAERDISSTAGGAAVGTKSSLSGFADMRAPRSSSIMSGSRPGRFRLRLRRGVAGEEARRAFRFAADLLRTSRRFGNRSAAATAARNLGRLTRPVCGEALRGRGSRELVRSTDEEIELAEASGKRCSGDEGRGGALFFSRSIQRQLVAEERLRGGSADGVCRSERAGYSAVSKSKEMADSSSSSVSEAGHLFVDRGGSVPFRHRWLVIDA